MILMAKMRKKNGSAEPQADVATMQPDLGAPQSAGDTSAATPDRDRIEMRAYELYLERGGADGAALEDWLSAERELSSGDRSDD